MTPLLEVHNLHVEFPPVQVVDGLDLTIAPGEIVALVGESGSGKTMTALSIGRLLPAAARWQADLLRFNGQDLLTMPEATFRGFLGRQLTYVFQDPAGSLNPVMTIEEQLSEPLAIHQGMRGPQARVRLLEWLTAVQLPDPVQRLSQYPHQLSGGMQQRVMLAMAMLMDPLLLIADEPTTALDATVQAQMLELLLVLRRRVGTAILLITHDLLQVAPIADRIAVMTQGRIVETAPTKRLYHAPQHPHTQALLRALPTIGAGRLSVP